MGAARRVADTMMRILAIAGLCFFMAACAAPPQPPLREIYSETAQKIGADRNPVVVIPGILGSRLVDQGTRQVVWGAFTYGAADADYPDGARLFALPMKEGARLADLRDEVEPDGVLESLEANVSLLKITALEPYRGIIRALAAGKYVDRDIVRGRKARSDDPIDYAGLHTTCFQFDYDWRRDISENASRLDELIQSAARTKGPEAKVDVVAHSMGGLVLLYYLRYGTQPLSDDGTLPSATWAGARYVEHAILVGTPSAGSILSLKQLIDGVQYAPIVPEYRPAIVGTMPSIYQLMPRNRHQRVVDDATGLPVGDFFDVATWERLGWGLAARDQDTYLAWLLPDITDPAERHRVAIDHLRKCLSRAAQLHRALDAPMHDVPAHLSISLFLGDAERTPSILAVNARTGRVRVRDTAPGDGTVTRASALMDERIGADFQPRLRSPIRWTRVQFIAADHVGLTEHHAFIDSLLFELLERPR